MINKEQLHYELLYYSLLKHAVESTSDFTEWYFHLDAVLKACIDKYNQGLKQAVPYWIYMTFIEKIKHSTMKEQTATYLNANPLLRTFIQNIFIDIIPLLDAWHQYLIDKHDVKDFSLKHKGIWKSDTTNRTQFNFFKRDCVKIPRSKSYIDLPALQVDQINKTCEPSS